MERQEDARPGRSACHLEETPPRTQRVLPPLQRNGLLDHLQTCGTRVRHSVSRILVLQSCEIERCEGICEVDDVLDNIRPVHHGGSVHRHVPVLDPLLLRAEDRLRGVASVAVHQGLQRALQEVRPPHAVLQGKGHRRVHLPGQGQKLRHAGALWEKRPERCGHSCSHGCNKGSGRPVGQAAQLQHAGSVLLPVGSGQRRQPAARRRRHAASNQDHDEEQVRESQGLLVES